MRAAGGPPPLSPFGLVLHRDGRFTHEGHPLTNRRLREAFERAVRYLPDERKYVVQLGSFRGEVVVEEAGFFVRGVDVADGTVALSDGSTERLDVASITPSTYDDGWLCRVKRDLEASGLPARFTHAAWAELLLAAEESPDGPALRLAGRLHALPGAGGGGR